MDAGKNLSGSNLNLIYEEGNVNYRVEKIIGWVIGIAIILAVIYMCLANIYDSQDRFRREHSVMRLTPTGGTIVEVSQPNHGRPRMASLPVLSKDD